MAGLSRVILLALVFLGGCTWLQSENGSTQLAILTVSDGTLDPSFVPSTRSYSATVDARTDSVTVVAAPQHHKARVSIDGGPHSYGGSVADVALSVGTNVVSIVVTAEDAGKQDSYEVTITRPAPSYSVGGEVAGLTGSLTLQINAANDLVLDADGPYSFATMLDDGASYDVSVSSQPIGQSCTVENAAGTISGDDIADVDVTCVPTTFSVGGMVNGLTDSVTLQNNGGDDLVVTTNGAFVFTTTLGDGEAYDVTISAQPTSGPECTVTNGAGTVSGANVTDIVVDCGEPSTYLVGTNVAGLVGTVTVRLNGSTDLLVTRNGLVGFADQFIDGTDFEITIQTQPVGQTCTIADGTGTIAGAHALATSVTCTGTGVVSGSIFDWNWVNPLPQGNSIHSFASDGSVLVAVGEAGTVLTTTDGLNWTRRDSGSVDYLFQVAWGNGQFVALGGNNILSSPDGITWQAQNLGNLSFFADVIWNGSEFLAVGYTFDTAAFQISGVVASSPDGQNWTLQDLDSALGQSARSVAWNGNVYAVLQFPNIVHTSPDGINWTENQVDLSGGSIYDFASDGTQFVGVGDSGNVYTSADGANWILAAAAVIPSASSITWDGSRFLAVGSENVHFSDDGSTWTSVPVDPGTSTHLLTATSFDGLTVLAGFGGAMYTSPDDVNWTPQHTISTNWLHAIIWDGGQFVATGDFGEIATSPDGTSWTSRNTGTAGEFLVDLARGDSQYIAVGHSPNGEVFTSPDAITWTPQAISGTDPIGLQGVAWGGNQFVAVGGAGLVLTSPDGATWTTQTAGLGSTDYLVDVTWNGSIWVATGTRITGDFPGLFLTSPDGIDWTEQTLPSWVRAESVVWNGSLFVAVGSGSIASSVDGLSWSAMQTTAGLTAITWTGGQFVAVGSDPQVLISDDGVTWSVSRSMSGSLSSIATNGSRIVVVGWNRQILTNDVLLGGAP